METSEIDVQIKAIEAKLAQVKELRRDVERIKTAMAFEPECEDGCGRYFLIPDLLEDDTECLVKEMDEFLKGKLEGLLVVRKVQLKRLLQDTSTL